MMNNIEVGENKVKLVVSRDIYLEKSVEETIDIFSENFEVEKKEKEDFYEIILELDSNIDFEKAGLEFFNFLLSKEKKSCSISGL